MRGRTFFPDLETDIRDSGPEVADDPAELTTSDQDKDFKIAEVLSPGYIAEGQGREQVIAPAKVSIYRYIR